MARSLREGTLVEIRGLEQQAADEQPGGAPFDANGSRAQLLRFEDGRWLAMTFEGRLLRVAEANVRPLEDGELPGVDVVFGPKNDEAVLAQEIISNLVLKGYCVGHSILSPSAVSQMLAAAQGLKYQRAPAPFEPYYLGRESREKTALIDFQSPETPESLHGSPLWTQDSAMWSWYNALAPDLEEQLGIRVTSRTNLMVRQTFSGPAEEAMFPGAAEASNAEKQCFMSLMKRKRVCMMQFLGPLTGKLALIPKGEGEDAEELQIEAAPGTTVLFLTERFQYSHTCSGATTTLQTWFLGQRPEFRIGEIGGDMAVLGGLQSTGVPAPQGEIVAVNGMATFLGADAKDYQCFWLMFNKAGGDTFVEIPFTRWDTSIYCRTDDMQTAQMMGLSYTKHQGFVDGIEFFDARFFGISNIEAASMDPNQRKTLETVYEALQMGGHDLKRLQRDPKNIGVFVGVSGSEWGQVPHPQDAAGCGGAEAIISNRCNFSLNLKGASQTINTACSSGLVAMHTGKLHLKYKDFDPMDAVVCCGTQLAYSPIGFIGCCSGAMLSFKGRCFTFDYSADGYGRGEGVSAVYMNLAEYSRDVFAVVAGSQANQDGRSASITAPNGPSQEKCIKAAFREAALKPPEVDCFECHGTGTALGDPIEVGAFKRIYNSAPREHTLLVTSSKTNLGHLEGGAGMAGFIKCCLQVMHAECSPNLHLREQNPHLDSEGFPALFTTEGLCCQFESAYSGVSSFGFGGTNAHAMAYGKNTTTTRRIPQRDLRQAMMAKITEAPPPEIIAWSDDPEDWETSGMPIGEEHIGKMFEVEVLEDGRTVWREVVQAQLVRRETR